MKTAGVVLDFYDDPTGEILKRAFEKLEDVPEAIKTAHILNSDERNVLRDEAYALILLNEGKELRKFACVDAGNTLLSCLYFEENAAMLPPEAIKVAGTNLARFCGEFHIDPTPFIKMAADKAQDKGSAMGKKRDPMQQPLVGEEADWASRTNLVSVRGGNDSGRVIPTANQMKTAESRQGGAQLTTDVRAVGVNQKNPPQQKKTTEAPDKNSFAIGPGKGDAEVNAKPTGWPQEKKAGLLNVYIVKGDGLKDASGLPSNKVDVSGKHAKPTVHKQASVRHAGENKYPLDSYADVKKAVEYFNDNWVEMDPEGRHEFCVKTASRADELGISTSDLMQRYGSEHYAPDVEAHLSSRKASCEKEFHEIYDALKEKRSSIEPMEFAKLLEEADRASGLNWYWGGDVADPYLSTFGGMNAKQAAAAWSWTSNTGDHVNADQLKKLAVNGRPTVHKHFSSEFANAFIKDPIGIFESMPDDSKKILARLADDGEFSGLHMN